MSNNIFSFLRLLVLLLGFAFICLGAYCFSTSASACKCNSLPIAYLLLPLGFFFLISGIFWSTYHEASKHKGLFHSLLHGSPRLQESHISTIDRPDFYPPSYEDSTDPEKQTFALPICPQERVKDMYNRPPPLYTESSLEFLEEASPQGQQPPSYEVSMRQAAEHDLTTHEEPCWASVSQASC
ncbi:transmembrane protein 252 [Zootoca vivipara]|uniref:transmembrane protein 252 n=1 Tax=Zootoca vivipara TaxID=8524 RepID=UPI00158FA1E1|nr:transmembrane protein 252 [Zootoca vivipara]XP_034956191.1 transmembrane protein 252 [Zootoca vivipara]